MNTFDYWFNYIVRNGELISTTLKFANRMWLLITENYEYEAVIQANGAKFIVAYHIIRDSKINKEWPDYVADQDEYDSLNFDCLKGQGLMKELTKPIL